MQKFRYDKYLDNLSLARKLKHFCLDWLCSGYSLFGSGPLKNIKLLSTSLVESSLELVWKVAITAFEKLVDNSHRRHLLFQKLSLDRSPPKLNHTLRVWKLLNLLNRSLCSASMLGPTNFAQKIIGHNLRLFRSMLEITDYTLLLKP